MILGFLLRSTAFDPEAQDLGGTDFALIAVVTNVDDDVNLGHDGIPHL